MRVFLGVRSQACRVWKPGGDLCTIIMHSNVFGSKYKGGRHFLLPVLPPLPAKMGNVIDNLVMGDVIDSIYSEDVY